MKFSRGVRLSFNIVALALACVLVAESLVFVSDQMVRPPLEGLENQIFDLAFQVRQQNNSHQKISTDDVVIIDIDDASIVALGRAQLWPRSYDARVINNIISGKPRAIGIDFLYTEPDTLSSEYTRMLAGRGFENPEAIVRAMRTDRYLGAAISNAENVYLSLFDDDTRHDYPLADSSLQHLRIIHANEITGIHYPRLVYPILPIPEFSSHAKAVGSISMPSMQDGTVRYYQLMQRLPGIGISPRYIGNFPFYMMLDEMGVPDTSVHVTKDGLELGSKGFIPLLPDGSFRLNWLGSEENIRYISYYKVLDELIPAEFFENKFVFFGTSAAGLQDLKTVPSQNDKMPGVEVHAVAFLNLMNQAFITEVSEMRALPYFLLFSILMVLGFLYLRPWIGFVVSIILIFGEMSFFVLWFLPNTGAVFPIVTLMLITFLSYISASLFTYFIREKKTRELKNAFGRYVSPQVVDQIVRNASGLKLGGEKKNLTVLFSDIRSFTKYSEQLDPQELVTVLNNYLSQMSEVIFRHKGTIDKFIGDAIMAIFGAPITQKDHADKGCHVALEMLQCLKNVNKDQAERGQRSLAIGIGLNTGDMTVGNIGSQRRYDYTVIGDAVNLGSRLENLTKFFEVDILVSEMTVNACTPGEFIFRELASVKVKGKDQPVAVFQLIGTTSSETGKTVSLSLWNEALEAFKKADLERALDLFKQYRNVYSNDFTARYYCERCIEYLAHPEHFSLVLQMESK